MTEKKDKRVIAVANQKGGVGKTTTAVTLAYALARAGQRVLLIDLDPHACASVHLRIYPGQRERSVCDLFTSSPEEWAALWPEILVQRGEVGIDVAPASISLSDLEVDLRDRQGKGVILKDALALVRENYDYVLIDCPPHLSALLVNALIAADLLIIPIQTDFLALHGMKLLFGTINLLNRALPKPIRYMALATMFDRRAKACQRVLELVHKKMGTYMFKTVIGMDTKFREAAAQGRVIYEINPGSRGGHEYELVAGEIMSL